MMALSDEDRAYVVETACDMLRHRHRERLVQILEDRLKSSDGYEHERELDRIVLVIAHVIDDELAEPS